MIKLSFLSKYGIEKCLVNKKYIKKVNPVHPDKHPEINSAVYLDDGHFWCSETVDEIEKMLKAEAMDIGKGRCWMPALQTENQGGIDGKA